MLQHYFLAYEVLADDQKRREYDSGGWSHDQQQQYAQDFDFDSFMREFQESMIFVLYSSSFQNLNSRSMMGFGAFHLIRYNPYFQ